MRWVVRIIFVVLLFGIGAAAGFFGRPAWESWERRGIASAEQRAREIMRSVLVDPESAQFHSLVVAADGSICGEMNSRNRMGGYVGFRRFVIWPGGLLEVDPGRERLSQYPSMTPERAIAELDSFNALYDTCARGLALTETR